MKPGVLEWAVSRRVGRPRGCSFRFAAFSAPRPGPFRRTGSGTDRFAPRVRAAGCVRASRISRSLSRQGCHKACGHMSREFAEFFEYICNSTEPASQPQLPRHRNRAPLRNLPLCMRQFCKCPIPMIANLPALTGPECAGLRLSFSRAPAAPGRRRGA